MSQGGLEFALEQTDYLWLELAVIGDQILLAMSKR